MASPAAADRRVASIDAYRGLVMFLMMAEVLRLASVAKALPDSGLWQFLAWHQTHVEWAGCSLHDLIQPSFSFLVGAALPFSLASRRARGQSKTTAIGHAIWRAVILVLLGVFLRSIGHKQTNFTFEDTLSQIGLGYVPLFLIGLAPRRVWCLALAAILIGYWGAFALYPQPGPTFDYPAVGVPADWPPHYTGFAAHWNKNSNLAWAFDTWFLNLFPREQPFLFNRGGYATLSFIPTLGTMLLGLIAGGWLRDEIPPARKLNRLLLAGLLFLAAGAALDFAGVCPSVKRIWTPAWTLFSGGWCFLILAGLYAVMDAAGYQAWAFSLRVIGMNSIAAYCIAHLFDHFIPEALQTHLGKDLFRIFGEAYQPFVLGLAVLTVYWLILYWMYRRGIFLRI
jgi:heparan-alpha-glucosaminide N-acetyltransferase